MAAGLGFKDFVTGEVLTAADVDGYLMQGVWVFASAAARDAAVTSPQEGNFAYLKDTNVTTYYTGSAWANLDTTGMTNPMTTTGDTIYSSSGSTPARLGIGSTGNVLTVAGGVPTWAAPAGGGGMTLLSTTTLSGPATVLSSISQSYKSLYVLITGVTNSTNDADFFCEPNAVSNLTWYIGIDQGSLFASNASAIRFTGNNVEYKKTDANNVWTLQLDNYTSASSMKPFTTNSSFIEPSYSDVRNVFLAGTYRSDTAITSLSFNVEGENFSTGTVYLYGVN